MATEQPADITITVKGPSELKLSVSIDPKKNVAALKELIASKCDVEKDRQRLIYSGKVMKDEETISTYKVQNGNTIHMVKGQARSAPESSPAAQPLPQMGTGLNVGGNPIDNVENIHHGLAGFNPFAQVQGMGNLNDPNAMTNMMQSPEFLQNMADMMSRPEVLDQIIASNPQLSSMGPQIRQMMQSPFFRQMMSNPETLRMMMQMQAGQGGGAGGLGGMGGLGGGLNPFGGAAPGAGARNEADGAATNAPTDPFPNLFAPSAGATATNTANPSTPSTPSTGAGAGGLPPGLAALLGGGGFGGAGGAGGAGTGGLPPGLAALLGRGGAGGAGAGGAGANPFANFDPSMLYGAGAGSPWGAPAPRDERPPEEIYATQLGQLNAMGLWDAQKNIRALRSTGGNVEAAIELIFSGQLDGQ